MTELMTTKTNKEMSLDKAIDKIRKLKALAENNNNANERQQAFEQMSKVMAEYNLELHNIDFKAGVKQLTVEQQITQLSVSPWKVLVCDAVARLNYTKFYMTRDDFAKDGKVACFIGTKTNIEVSINIAKWLIEMIGIEAMNVFSELRDRQDFCIGAATKLRQRAIDIENDEKRQEKTGAWKEGNRAELMVVKKKHQEANEEWTRQNIPRMSHSSVAIRNNAASGAGEKFGASIGLDKQVTGNAATKRLNG